MKNIDRSSHTSKHQTNLLTFEIPITVLLEEFRIIPADNSSKFITTQCSMSAYIEMQINQALYKAASNLLFESLCFITWMSATDNVKHLFISTVYFLYSN